MSIRVRNWRDQAPYVGHISALVWTLYQSHDKDETSPPEVNRLHGINSFVKHGLQGHQHSDHHQHDNIEQLYFILRGRGQLTIGDDKVDVRDGTAVYMPVNVPHQAFNDGEGWMEHLIVSCPLDEIREGTPAVRDWRDVHPVVLEGGTVSWPLLLRQEEAPANEGGVLQRVHGVTRYAVQGRQGTAWQQLDGIELVHYVLSGYGTVEDLDGNQQLVTEGSAAHVLPGVAHRFANQGEGWFEYVTFAVEVGEVEMPQEADELADSEEAGEQYGVEEAAAAAVVAEVDWDDADAVETEEEIEEALAVDAIDEDSDEVEAEADEVEAEEESEVEADDSDEIESEADAAGEEAEEGVEGEEETGDDEGDQGDDEVSDELEMEEDADEEGDGEDDSVGDDDADWEEAEADEEEAEDTEDGEDADVSDEDGLDEDDGIGEDEDEVEEVLEDDEIDEEEDAADEEDGEESDVDEDSDADEESDEAGDVDEEDDEVETEEDDDGEEADEDEIEPSNADSAETDSSGDEDDFDLDDDDADFDLDDDDADFDIEDDEETAEEDDTGGEDDDSPDTYRR